jgi:hypothetical protein
MKYNKEQHINTHSTITTYILQHSCYSFGSLYIRAGIHKATSTTQLKIESPKPITLSNRKITFFLLYVKYLELGPVTIYIM